MIRPDLSLPIPDEIHTAHFIGIGGSGMSGLARMFLDAGIAVTGSDRSDSEALRLLAEAGARVYVGHDAAHLGDADTVVHTGAIWPENPEFVTAKERGLSVIHRSQALHWLTRGRRIVSVAGAHGKTTSTGMLVTALQSLQADPSFVSGGVLSAQGVSSGTGHGELVVIEADESDGTFLLYDTSVALITNIDPDHVDFYGSDDAFHEAFARFAAGASQAVVLSADDSGTQRLLRTLASQTGRPAGVTVDRVLTFGEAPQADLRVSGILPGPRVHAKLHYGTEVAELELSVPGDYNAINAAGAVAVLIVLGYSLPEAAAAVAGYAGTGRRFEKHGEVAGVSVYDDYAHHPTEVAAVLQAARSVVGPGRIIAIQQPHTYSRTQHMFAEFAAVLEEYADHTVVLDVHGAREDPIPGVTGELVSGAFTAPDQVHFVADWQAASDYTASVVQSGDFVVTLGCGNVYLMIPQILQSLQDRFQA